MSTIAVDVMGGDYAPRAIVEGIGEWLASPNDATHLILVGDQGVIEAELDRMGCRGDARVSIVHAPDVVSMDDSPAAAIRSKRQSSINIAVDLVKTGEARAIFSAGNTGAAVASTVLKLRMLPGIERPAIATVFPSPEGKFLLLDAGSTVDCKPTHLLRYAIMGDVYDRRVLGISDPRIGLLNVGDESVKGNDLAKETFKLLSQAKSLNFIGNVEGSDLFSGCVDVVVCDGFVGNIVLKTCESLAGALSGMLRECLGRTIPRKVGYLLSRGAFQELHQMCDHSEFGGAPLLGVNGVCIIGHGSSTPKAVRNAIRVSEEFIEHEVNAHIISRVQAISLQEGACASAPS